MQGKIERIQKAFCTQRERERGGCTIYRFSVRRIVREETRGYANNWQPRSLTLNIALRNNQPAERGWSEGNLQRGGRLGGSLFGS